MDNIILQILTPAFGFAVLRVTAPILFAAIGNVVSDRAGVTNIAMEGTMLIAAFTGTVVSAFSGSAWVGLLAALGISILFSAFLAYLHLYLGISIIMGGIALNLFASSFTVFLLYMITGQKGNSASLASKQLPNIDIPVIKDIPILVGIISGQNILVYVAALTVILVYIMLKKTKLGMRIRAVGENTDAASSVGINTKRIQFIALCLSGLIAGFGGAYMSMGYLSIFTRNMVAGRGWIALAASAMGKSMVIPTMITAFLFGFFDAVGNVLQLGNLPAEIIMTLPYMAVLVGLIGYSIKKSGKEKKKNA